MRIHLVGNGPSWVNYKREPGEFAIGCNEPLADVDITMFTDLRFAYKVREGIIKINIPALVNEKVGRWLQSDKGQEAGVEIYDIYDAWLAKDILNGNKEWTSTAHCAARYAIDVLGATELYVWGCDSYFTLNAKSHTDKYIYSKNKYDENDMHAFTTKWQAAWDKMIEHYKDDCKIVMIKGS